MPDRPVEILALPEKLHELFDRLLPVKANGDAEQNERDFLTIRALGCVRLHQMEPRRAKKRQRASSMAAATEELTASIFRQ